MSAADLPAHTIEAIEAERDALESLAERKDKIGAYARRLLEVVE